MLNLPLQRPFLGCQVLPALGTYYSRRQGQPSDRNESAKGAAERSIACVWRGGEFPKALRLPRFRAVRRRQCHERNFSMTDP